MIFTFLLLLTASGIEGAAWGLGAYIAFMVVYYVLYVIGAWKMFSKAGIPGWHAFIPFLNEYDVFKMAWETKYYWIYLLGSAVYYFAQDNTGTVWNIIEWVLAIVIFVIGLVCVYKLAKAFNKGVGYTIGLIIFEAIFIMILGLGSAKYVGPLAKKSE